MSERQLTQMEISKWNTDGNTNDDIGPTITIPMMPAAVLATIAPNRNTNKDSETAVVMLTANPATPVPCTNIDNDTTAA